MNTFLSLGARAFFPPAPILLLACHGPHGPLLTTVTMASPCCEQPPCLCFSLKRTAPACAALLERKALTLGMPAVAQVAAVDYVHLRSAENEGWPEKFVNLGFEPLAAEHVDAPLPGGCLALMEAALLHSHELGSHVHFVAEIMDLKIAESCFGGGQLRLDALDPLLCSPLSGEYRALGRFVARILAIGKTVADARV